MKKTVLLMLPFAVLAAAVIEGQEKQSELQSNLVTMEEQLWDAWKNGDAKPFETHLADEYVMVMPTGVTSGKAKAIKEITDSSCDVKSFSLSDWKLSMAGKGTAILTYKASQDAVCDGNKVAAEVYSSVVYVKKGDKWLAASYQETPAVKTGP